MSDDVHPSTATPQRRRALLFAVVVGALLAVGGVVAGLIAKAHADYLAGLRLVTVPCPQFAACLDLRFPAPDYSGLWTGVIVAVIGVVVVAVALFGGYVSRRAA